MHHSDTMGRGVTFLSDALGRGVIHYTDVLGCKVMHHSDALGRAVMVSQILCNVVCRITLMLKDVLRCSYLIPYAV